MRAQVVAGLDFDFDFAVVEGELCVVEVDGVAPVVAKADRGFVCCFLLLVCFSLLVVCVSLLVV